MQRHLHRFASGFASLLLVTTACVGEISSPGASDGGEGREGEGGELGEVEAPRFARLTHSQWEHTVEDLLGITDLGELPNRLHPDPPLGRFTNNIARLLITGPHWESYQFAAEQLAARVVEDEESLARILPTGLPDLDDVPTTARAFITHFGAQAFRRPLSDVDLDRYETLFARGTELFREDDELRAGVRIVIEAMLQSPHFLYRAETGEDLDPALSGYHLASRLSYFFWDTMPDAELFAAAASGVLETEEGLRAQAERMFDDPRTREQFKDFHYQAFKLGEYADLDKDVGTFPQWSRELGQMMQQEMLLFFDSVVFDDGTIADVLTSTRAYVNSELAAIYGLLGGFGEDFVPVELDSSERAGFITRAGFLTRNATLTQPDPIHRGVFINHDLVCRDLPALPDLPEYLEPVGDTNRERITSITGPNTCGEQCHATIINPPGFALESFDALGQIRTTDNGFPLDLADTYEFEDGRQISFVDGVDLSRQLARAPEFHACYVQKLLEFAGGRNLEPPDQPFVQSLAAASLADGLTVREIVLRIVTSDSFRPNRRS